MTVLNEAFQGIDLGRYPLLERVRDARLLRTPVPVGATAVALVALGYAVAFGVAMVLGGWLEPLRAGPHAPVAASVLGGLLIGLPMAVHVLHRELASPVPAALRGPDGSVPYVYAGRARRRMALGLAWAYAAVAAGALALAAVTGVSRDLAAMLAY
jgi:hypothetical protein